MIMINMKGILKMVNQMEKVYIIFTMVTDMKANFEIGKKKEKVYIIIIMVIEEWVIILMINQ